MELAAGYEHFEIFNLKKIRLDPSNPQLSGLLFEACHSKKSDFLEKLLEKGFNPGELENKGCFLINSLLSSMSWYFDYNPWDIGRSDRRAKRNLDTDRSREKIKMIHMLAKHGAKWLPSEASEISDARRSLLKMSPDYTVEFIWIISKYNACKREDLEELIGAPSMKSLISKYAPRVKELMGAFDSNTTVPAE